MRKIKIKQTKEQLKMIMIPWLNSHKMMCSILLEKVQGIEEMMLNRIKMVLITKIGLDQRKTLSKVFKSSWRALLLKNYQKNSLQTPLSFLNLVLKITI